jgi:hypothetical protein
MIAKPRGAKSSPGIIVATPGALAAFANAGQTPDEYPARHLGGDRGDGVAGDRRANDEDLGHGGRLLSSHRLNTGVKSWIISEADRSSTRVLLPEEY